MAAEIALAPEAERRPRFFKTGMATLEKDIRLPRQITELAGALGTTVLVDGNRKRAKRLFQQSLTDPTGNSLAQAEWASGRYGEVVVAKTQLQSSSDANEAMARHLFRTGDFEQSLMFVRKWIEEEPFSSHPYWSGAMTANILEEYEKAEKLTEEGLRHDPKSLPLLSNRIFSLACLGRLDEAEELLNTVPIEAGKDVYVLIGEADRGLIALRRGQVSEGQEHYRRAIAGFRHQQNLEMERLAQAYFAREAVRAGIAHAEKLVADAEKSGAGSARPAVERVLNSARAMLDAGLQNSAPAC